MLGYIEYLGIPGTVAAVMVAIFLGMQIVGELLELKGKVVPEILKIRKYFRRKKQERETLSKMTDMLETLQGIPDTLTGVQNLLASVDQHYSADNIKKRDKWIENVNNKLEDNDRMFKAISEKLDQNNADTLAILIENKRNTILNFAKYVINENAPVTHEQFRQNFKIHNEYENIIHSHGLTNGEVDTAMRIIRESYETHLRNRTFIEDVRGYENG